MVANTKVFFDVSQLILFRYIVSFLECVVPILIEMEILHSNILN